MSDSVEVQIVERSGIFAFDNSISSDQSTAHVVPLSLLEQYLREISPEAFMKLDQMYSSFGYFLKVAGRDIVRAGLVSWQQWNYELMTVRNYYTDKRHEHECFSNLTWDNLNENSILFVFYAKEDKKRYEAERASMNKKSRQRQEMNDYGSPSDAMTTNDSRYENMLSNEILGLCHNLTPTQKAMDSIRHLRKKIQNMLNSVWPNMNYQVVIFGSSANSLALTNADVDFCIVVPESRYEQDLHQYRNKLPKLPKSVYNMFFLASRLRSIGMRGVEAIGNASVPICKFVDPHTGLNCDINANNILGIENTQLIQKYCDLDSRIRPLIFAIKQFVKQKNINNPRGGTLSSYAYVIMVLHFLMSGLRYPVIPSLQRLQVTCTSRDCNFKSFKPIPVLHNHQIIKCDARYHDCVQIEGVGDYGLPVKGATTVWQGRNTDSIATLLTQFFQYYSDENNYTISIISADGELFPNEELYPHKDPFTIQDPFITSKNVARSCTTIGSRIIIQEFQRAATLLSSKDLQNHFSLVCDPKLNLSRPVDTESMEYRFQQRDQRKIVRQDKVVGYLGNGRRSQTTIVDSAAKRTIDLWTGSESDAEVIQIEETYTGEHFITRDRKASSPLKIERSSPSSSVVVGGGGGKHEQPTSSSSGTSHNTAATSSGSTADGGLAPIFHLVKKIMALKPNSENGLETFATEPCTDMYKLLEDPVIKEIQTEDIIYLITQLNSLGDAVANKMIFNAVHEQQQQQQYEQIQHSALAETQELRRVLEEIRYDDDEDDDDDDEYDDDSYQFNGTDESDIEDEDEVNVNYMLNNVPDYLESYEIYNLFQWYGRIIKIEYIQNPPSWCVRMVMKYKSFKLLPVNPEFDGFTCDGQAHIL